MALPALSSCGAARPAVYPVVDGLPTNWIWLRPQLGLSDDEWKQTLDFIKEIGFGDVHIFPYSARHGTAATRLPGRIPREITRQRTEQLHALASDLKINALQRQVGRQVPVLWEKRRDDGTDVGYTPSFFRVLRNKPDQPSLENRITDTHLRGVSPDGANLLGEAK